MASLKRTLTHLSLCLLPLGLGCADGYVPPKDTPIIIDGNNMTEPPAGSAGVEVGTPSGALIEGGSPASVSIKLLRAPTAPVRLSLSSSNIAEGTVAPAELTFDAQDWSQAKEVTLTPGDDEIADGDKRWQLKLVISSEDATFASEQVRPLNLTTIDNDVAPQIVITPLGAPRTTEAGGSVTVQVVLTRQPSSDVLIPVRIDDPSEASTTTTSVTLNALDWNVPHELVLTGLDDMTKDGDVRYKLTLGPANSTDEAFNGIGPSSLELTNVDGVCGNGVVDGKEGCEPKEDQAQCEFGQRECMVCSNACEYVQGTTSGWCGDGKVQRDQGEECDEPTAPCDYNLMSCQVCGPRCTLIPGALQGYCGDNKLQAQFEDCDGPTKPCDYGQRSCMTCRSCKNIPGQVTGYCGDGIVQSDRGEECEQDAMCPGLGGIAPCNNCKLNKTNCNDYVAVTTGLHHSCGLLSDGDFRCWGSSSNNQSSPSLTPPIKAIAASENSTAITSAPSTYVFGRMQGRVSLGDMSQIDLASYRVNSSYPYVVNLCGLSATGVIDCKTNDDDIIQIDFNAPYAAGHKDVALGYYDACAINSAGDPICWGAGLLPAPPNAKMIDISGGTYSFCGIRGSDGSITCWGPPFTSLTGPQGTGFTKLDVGPRADSHAEYGCALHATGMTCWGALPADVPQSTSGSFTQVSVGGQHVCALTTDGAIECWGSNQQGQLNVASN